jgi:hypothetical protein
MHRGHRELDWRRGRCTTASGSPMSGRVSSPQGEGTVPGGQIRGLQGAEPKVGDAGARWHGVQGAAVAIGLEPKM